MRGNTTAYNISCARVIISTIKSRGLPVRAAHLAITTAIVETHIRNLDYGDSDSLGLFQQRPSAGWGTPEQIMNPVYATNQFLNKMLTISDWRTGPIGRICQDVQRSAYPQRYYDATPDGVAIANAVWAAINNPDPQIGHSVTGDSYTDLVAWKAGAMFLYSNNFARDNGWPYHDVRQIGSGWNFEHIVAADATGDGYTDLVAWKSDGTMWLYSNNFVRDNGWPYSDYRQIGSGWGIFDRIVAADATGDGYTDLVAWKSDGTMWLYSNNFNRDNGHPYHDVRQIGSGWNFDRIVAADATGDGYTDLVAWKSDGTMWLYSNNFERDNGWPYSDYRQIGSGWGVYDRIVASDATGDGYTDLVAWNSDGAMFLYSNNFARDNGHPYHDVRQIGSGWNMYDRIVA